MFIIENYTLAIIFCVLLPLVDLLGFVVTLKNWLPANGGLNFYWDYVIGILLFSWLLLLPWEVPAKMAGVLADIKQQASGENIHQRADQWCGI